MQVNKILVPVDFSDNSEKILKSALFMAKKCGASISVVVQSIEDYSGFFVPHIPITQFEEEMVEGANKRMESFMEENMDRSVPGSAKVLIGDVAEEIIKLAEAEQMDLIVMGTHGYKGVEKVLFGSVAEQVVKRSPCPVLTINPYK
ncbi:MAG: universal stress protein [Desulfobacteraceae bacterium]|nr:universal stress protein [Desulfobacteraceae bacterium]